MKRIWKRCLGLGLALTLLVQVLPTDGWYLPAREVEAAGELKDFDETQKLDKFINNQQLLAFLKKMLKNEGNVNKADDAFTIGDLMDYTGEIILTEAEKDVGNVIGLGYARSATKIDLSALVQLTRIEDWEFYYCNMNAMVLPESLTSIGANAFKACGKLSSINLPDKLESISENAFDGCIKLDGITLPDGIKTIASQAFMGCSSLTSITLPSSKTEFGEGVFWNCTSLYSVLLPEGLTYIPTSFFRNTSSLYSITFPNQLVEIGDHAFNASAIGTVNLSETKINKIGNYAFANTGYIEVTFPGLEEAEKRTLETIGDLAFTQSAIYEINLPEGLTYLGNRAFTGCEYIQKITLPSTLKMIQEETFTNCKSLKTVNINNGSSKKSELETVGIRAFYGCYSLPGTQFLKDLEYLTSIENQAFASCSYEKQYFDENNRIKYDIDIYGNRYKIGNFKVVELPDSLKTLGTSVFKDCSRLEKVSIANTAITELPIETFQNCEQLQYVDLPDNLEVIGQSCFENCIRLREVDFPENDTLVKIGNYAFRATGKYGLADNSHQDSVFKVAWMYVPENLINADNISDEGCFLEAYTIDDEEFSVVDYDMGKIYQVEYKQAKQVYIKLSPQLGEGETFRNIGQNRTYLELAKVAMTEEEDGYVLVGVPIHKDYTYRFEGFKTSISFDAVENLKDTNRFILDFPAVNNFIGVGNVFTGLEKLEIPDSVTEFGEGVFQNSKNLKEVKLSSSLSIIPKDTFRGCGEKVRFLTSSGVSSSTADNGGISGGISRFLYAGLKKVILPTKLTEIKESAFEQCYSFNLENGALPTTLAVIGNRVFYECASITKLVAPSSLVTIGENAFYKTAPEGKYTYSYEKELTGEKVLVENVLTPEKGYGLSEVDFSRASNLTTIGKNAFALTNITKVDLMPASKLRIIESGTFSGCRFLETFTGGNAVEYVGSKAFENNSSIKVVSVPSLAVLHQDMFLGNTNAGLGFTIRPPVSAVGVNYRGEAELPLYTVSDTTKNGDGLKVQAINVDEKKVGWTTDTKKTMRYEDMNFNVNLVNLLGKEIGETRIKVICNLKFNRIPETGKYIIVQPEIDFDINVTEKICKSITFNQEQYYLPVNNANAKITLAPKIEPEDTTDLFEWTTSQENVVDLTPLTTPSPIDPSTLKVLPKAEVKIASPAKLGQSEVTLKAGAASKKCHVNVVVPANYITLSKTAMNLHVGMEDKIDATLNYATGYDLSSGYVDVASFTSSNEKVVTVDQEGKVKAVDVGTATITVKALASGATSTCAVTVAPEDMETYLTYKGNMVDGLEGPIRVYAGETLSLGILTDPVDVISDVKLFLSEEDIVNYSFTNTGSKKTGINLTPRKPGVTTLILYPAFLTTPPSEPNRKSKVQIEVIADATDLTLRSTLQTLEVGKTSEVFQSINSKLGTASRIIDVPNVTSDTLRFSSSDTAIARVDEKTGEVTGVGAGTVTITATSTHKEEGSIVKRQVIEVRYPDATSVEINGPRTLNVGASVQYTATLTPIEARNAVEFSLAPGSAEGVLLVDKNGLVTAVGKGTVYIRATTDNGKTRDINITSIQRATGIEWLKAVELNVGAIYTLSPNWDYKLLPEGATDTIAWSSENPNIATVNETSGQISGVSKGTATIVGTTTTGLTTRVEVKVNLPSTAVTIENEVTMDVGQQRALTASMTPTDSTDTLTWTTNNSTVATVNENGVITAVGKGICNINVRTSSGRTASCRVNVNLPASGITWMKSEVTLNVGAIYTLSVNTDYKLLPEGTTDSITWSSQNAGIATVNEKNGQITGVARGTTAIIGTTASGVTSQINVIVKSPSTAIAIDKEMTLNVGQQRTLTAGITPVDSSDDLKWTTSNDKVAKVNENGVVTAVGKGICSISVSTTSGRSATCNVTVNLPSKSVKIQTNTVSQKTLYLPVKGTITLNGKLTPTDTTDTIKWTSSKKKIATVNEQSGMVTAIRRGTTTITARTSSGKKASIKVIVVRKPSAAKKITIAKKKTLKRKKTMRLTPKMNPKKSTDTLTWTTSNAAVATVDGYGNIVGVKKGKVKITVQTSSGKTSTCNLTVK